MVNEEIIKKFGIELRRLRLGKNLSQEKLALNCGLDRTYISMLERGQRQPTLSTIFTLSEELEILPSKLMKMIE